MESQIDCDVMSIELESPWLVLRWLAEDRQPVVLRSEAGTALAITEEAVVGKRDVTGLSIALRAENCGKEVASALQLLFI